MSKISAVYRIRSLSDGKMYIGSSIDVHKRFSAHRNLLKRDAHYNKHLQRAWNVLGADNFIFEIIEEAPADDLLNREQAAISKYSACNDSIGYNFSEDTLSPMRGKKHSKETLQKISESHIGKKHTDESRNKIRQAHLGRKKSEKHIESMSRVRLGKPLKESTRRLLKEIRNTPEWRVKQSTSQKKRDFSYLSTRDIVERSANTRRRKFIITSPNGESFTVFGLSRFCRENGLDQGSMSNVANGRYKYYKGWICKHAD